MGLLGKQGGAFKGVSAAVQRGDGECRTQRLNVRAIGKYVKCIERSDGKAQKVVIAKSLVQDPDATRFDEPTRGVDVDVDAIAGSPAEINRLADAGKSVVVNSSYPPELMALSDRTMVAKPGKGVVESAGNEATQEGIMYAAVH